MLARMPSLFGAVVLTSFSAGLPRPPLFRRSLLSSTSLVALGWLAATVPSRADVWTGNTSTDWFTGTNWSAGVPTLAMDVDIGTVTPNGAVIGAAGAQSANIFVFWPGTLTLQTGGTLTTQSHGYVADGGMVTVTGSLSTWTTPGSLRVGYSGNGTLTIQNSGQVISNIAYIGGGSGVPATGAVTLSGTGSTWTVGDLSVGAFLGNGTLTIQNGANLMSNGVAIGNHATATGAVTIKGQSSYWINTNFPIYVGFTGKGTLTIQDATTIVSAPGVTIAQSLGSFGTLNIGAGRGQAAAAPGGLTTPGVDFGAGTGEIVFNHTASDYVFAPAISGAGTVGVEAGTTILTGANTYSGPTTVDGGILRVNGSIASSSLTTVNAGGTLGGNGVVGKTLINGGTLAPGNSIGLLTVQGSLTFTAASTYLVEVSPANADRTNVTGAATLTGGTVQASFAPGNYLPHQYTILHATGGLGNTAFSSISGNVPAGFTQSLSYTATDVLLNLTASLGRGGALAGNQHNAAIAINNFFNGGGALPPAFLNLFGLGGGNLNNALSQLSGEAGTGGQQSAFQLGGQFLNLMLDPFIDGRGGIGGGGALGFAPEREALPDDVALAYAKVMKTPPVYKAPAAFEHRWSVWGSAFGGYSTTKGDAVAGTNDFTARAGGVAAGLDVRLTPDSVIGFGLAGGATSWTLADGLGGGRGDAFQAGIYGKTRSGPLYVAGAFAFANHWTSTDRTALGDHLTANFTAQSFGGRIESGYRFVTPLGGISPYVALQAQSFRTPFYSETDLNGGGFGLTYNGRSSTDTRSELGARFDRVAAVTQDAVITLRSRLAWAHDWVNDPSLTAIFQALPGASFVVNGARPDPDSALVSAGAEKKWLNGISLAATFEGEFSRNVTSYAGKGVVRYQW